MAAKYGFSDVCEGLVEDLKGAYPTEWKDFRITKVLGEDIFGLPKPHPNAVLNLFLEHNIKFALPLAAYRAALGGFSSLISDGPGMTLPRLSLASAIYGMESIRQATVQALHSIVYGRLGVCPQGACVLSVSTKRMEPRMEALKKVIDIVIEKGTGDMLSPPSLGDPLCTNCAELLENAYLRFCAQPAWLALPRLLWVERVGET